MPNVALTGLAADLAARSEAGKDVRVGIIGSGEMGTDLVTQIAHMKGIVVGAITERTPGTAFKAVRIAYGDEEPAMAVASSGAIDSAIEAGRIAVCEDPAAVTSAGLIDVVIDATGKPDVGAETGMAAIEAGKHLVMMNVEADVTIGRYLKAEARRAGVVYSLGAGDEPSSVMELIGFVTAMGHDVVCAGKGKNNPLDHDAVPDDYWEEAARRNMNPRMLVEFVDGSKTMVEMAAIANATGLVPDKPGMHGPTATSDTLHEILCPVEDGGVLSAKGRVDFTLGKGVAPGVFVIAHMDHPRFVERMNDLHLEGGPYFTFLRPFHLTSLEVPLTCARAVLYGTADMVPLDTPVAEVCALAKRDLKAGEKLEAIGETSYRSWIMTAVEAKAAGAVPVGLLEGGTVIRPVAKGALLTYADCHPDETLSIVRLRQLQDEMVQPTPM